MKRLYLITACSVSMTAGLFFPLAVLAVSLVKSQSAGAENVKSSPKAPVASTEVVPATATAKTPATAQPVSKKPGPQQIGLASWYGGSFIGGKTANGERYHAGDRTAAHRHLPFGTLVRVTNLRNQRSAVVRINNRGPYIKGRIIDLSRQVAVDLAMIDSGTAKVRLEVLAKPQPARRL